MPMREECKHYQSRTYPSGEVARFCVLDLAPNAPWSCPDDCPRYVRRLADAGWVHGSLVDPAIEEEPNVPMEDASKLLDEAENIVNAIGPEARREAEKREANSGKSSLRRFFGRRRGGK